ncbi:hypothetical protein BH24ACT4_BH24ACT4_14640 [soil metagenome]
MRARRTFLAVGALSLLGLLAPSPAGAAQQADGSGRILSLERTALSLERRIVPFDGRAQEVDGTEVTVTLDADVLFEFDQATLTAQAQQTLTELAAELDDTLAGDSITVIGHTDGKGEPAYNQDLSERRAGAVRDFLTLTMANPPQFEVAGRGETEPVADNEKPDGSDDPDGRRRNRRVEITYTAEAEQPPPEADEPGP